jgi:hypothetical protein
VTDRAAFQAIAMGLLTAVAGYLTQHALAGYIMKDWRCAVVECVIVHP